MRHVLQKIPENLPKQITKLYKKYLREDNKIENANYDVTPFVSAFTYYVWFRQNKNTTIENLTKTFVYDKVFPIVVRLSNDLVYVRLIEEFVKESSISGLKEIINGENIIKQYVIELTNIIKTQYGHFTECNCDDQCLQTFITLLLVYYFKPANRWNTLHKSISKNIDDPSYESKIQHVTLQCEIHKQLINALYKVLSQNRNEFIIFINNLAERLY